MVLLLFISRASVLFEISNIYIGGGDIFKLFDRHTIHVDYKESISSNKH